MQGIDVSHHNGSIDWQKVKQAGKEFAFVRIGWSGYEGEIHKDKRFDENVRGAKEAGLKVGVYVYSYNKNPESAERTACEIIQMVHGKSIDLPIAFDLEETKDKCLTSQGKNHLWKTAIAFLNKIEQAGYISILYSYTAFITSHLDMKKLSEYDLWIADYRKPKEEGKCPSPYNHTIWQYAGNAGRCDGVEGDCDLNVCYVNYSVLSVSEEIDYKSLYEREKAKVKVLSDILSEIRYIIK